MTSSMNNVTIAGVDGCRAGWIVASRAGIDIVDRLDDVIATQHVIGIDMPIGLPPRWARSADNEARAALGTRRSTIFDTLPRPLLDQPTHAAANALSRRLFDRGISVQSWNLAPKIREVDALMNPDLETRIVEIHPECAFMLMAGRPLVSKHTADGVEERSRLLADRFDLPKTTPLGAARHDLLDAYAVLWSAERFATGRYRSFGQGERDERGLLMRIVA